MNHWWRSQAYPTKLVVVGLVLLLGSLLSVRVLWPREPAQNPAATELPGNPAVTESPSSSVSSAESDEKEVPCPPDSQILKDYGDNADGFDLYDHLCVGDYVTVWIEHIGTADLYDPNLWIMKRVGTRSLEPMSYDVFLDVFCGIHEAEIKNFPRAIIERMGCEYWGRNPPEDSPHGQVLRRQQEFVNALEVGDTTKLCAMLGPRALQTVEESGGKCQTLHTRLENILREYVQPGSPPDPRFVQATSQFAITAGYQSLGFPIELRWSMSGDPPAWRVTHLQCLTLTGEC